MGQIVRTVILGVVLVALLLPLYIMVVGSFEPLKILLVMPPQLIPFDLTLENYQLLLQDTEVMKWTLNTLIVCLGIACGARFVAATAGYGFAVYRFKGRRLALTFLISLIVLPGEVLLVPTFVMLRKIGIANGFAAAILPKVLSVMGIAMFKNYIDKIPRGVIESGRIAGASEWRIMWQLVLPQCKPMFGMIALFYGIAGWSDFIWQLLTMRKHKTLIVGLILHMRNLTIIYNGVGMMLAVGTILFIPMLLIFLATNRMFLEKLSLAGVRG